MNHPFQVSYKLCISNLCGVMYICIALCARLHRPAAPAQRLRRKITIIDIAVLQDQSNADRAVWASEALVYWWQDVLSSRQDDFLNG